MNNEIRTEEWYQSMVEDCQAIITETVFISRQALIEGKHQVGERICADTNFKKLPRSKKATLKQIFQDIGIGRAEGYSCVLFYEKFPILSTAMDQFKEQKNISWTKIKQNYLPEIKEEKEPLLPIKGKYNIFVIDPPWPYGTKYNEDSRRVASPYPEKSIKELSEWGKIEFEKSSGKDSVIWLWTTHKFLKDSFQLLEDWGFEYKLTMVWDKQKLGMGEWLRCQAEFCLLGVKGNYHKHWNLSNERDIISCPRREHSRKPEEFYYMVRKLCNGKRLDIFSREKHDGFDQYGNEPNKF